MTQTQAPEKCPACNADGHLPFLSSPRGTWPTLPLGHLPTQWDCAQQALEPDRRPSAWPEVTADKPCNICQATSGCRLDPHGTDVGCILLLPPGSVSTPGSSTWQAPEAILAAQAEAGNTMARPTNVVPFPAPAKEERKFILPGDVIPAANKLLDAGLSADGSSGLDTMDAAALQQWAQTAWGVMRCLVDGFTEAGRIHGRLGSVGQHLDELQQEVNDIRATVRRALPQYLERAEQQAGAEHRAAFVVKDQT